MSNIVLEQKESNGIDKCINCGMCRKSCEVYNLLLDERFGARGRAVLAKKDIIDKTFYYCTLCGRCNIDCPLGIDMKEEFKKFRAKVKEKLTTKSNRTMIENIRKYGNPFGELKEGEIPKELFCC
ncbi:MAG: (Fe-S)-binding protein [archaeon]